MSNISELAKVCSVSRKTVYSWCAKNGVRRDSQGRYRLSADDERALIEHYKKRNQPEATQEPSSPEPFEHSVRSNKADLLLMKVLQEQIEDLRGQVSFLTGQVEAKDSQIKSLGDSLRTSQEALSSTAKALENAQREVEQAHALHAANQGLLKAPEQPSQPADVEVRAEEPQEPSKGFWARLFDAFR